MGELLKSQIDRAKPREADYWLWDGKTTGFAVRVWPGGKKVFMYVYRPKGHGRAASKKKVTIGTYGSITVEKARTEALRLAGLVASGQDPAHDRDEKRRELHAESTVSELVSLFLADRRAKKRPTTVAEYSRLLNADVLPRLGRRKVGNVSRADIAALHRGMSDRPYLANRALAILHAAFAFAESRAMRLPNGNPCAGIEPYAEQPRERYLTDAEFAALGVALDRAAREGLPAPEKLRSRRPARVSRKRQAKLTGRKRGPSKLKGATVLVEANPFAVAAIRFLLLSGWRKGEALSLKWEHLDEQRRTATLPTTKTGRSVRHLGAAAWQLLATLPRSDDSPYVFLRAPRARKKKASASAEPDATRRKPLQPLKGVTRTWEAVRHAAGLESLRLHDLRHSHASVGAGDIGLSLHTIGALLGHREVSTARRYAHLADSPLQRAADAVAGRVATLIGETQPSTNVLPFVKKSS